jgi:hypothetical protein
VTGVQTCALPICHKRATGKGKVVGNNNYKRDYNLKIDPLIEQIAAEFYDPAIAKEYLKQIRNNNPRYIRDQLMLIKKQNQTYKRKVMWQALCFCIENKIFKATDLGSVAKKIHTETSMPAQEHPVSTQIKSLSKSTFRIIPGKSSISDYKSLMS